MKPDLSIVKDEAPNMFMESLSSAMDHVRHEELRGMALVYITHDDKIFTDYVKADGTSLTELLGCVRLMDAELLEACKK